MALKNDHREIPRSSICVATPVYIETDFSWSHSFTVSRIIWVTPFTLKTYIYINNIVSTVHWLSRTSAPKGQRSLFWVFQCSRFRQWGQIVSERREGGHLCLLYLNNSLPPTIQSWVPFSGVSTRAHTSPQVTSVGHMLGRRKVSRLFQWLALVTVRTYAFFHTWAHEMTHMIISDSTTHRTRTNGDVCETCICRTRPASQFQLYYGCINYDKLRLFTKLCLLIFFLFQCEKGDHRVYTECCASAELWQTEGTRSLFLDTQTYMSQLCGSFLGLLTAASMVSNLSRASDRPLNPPSHDCLLLHMWMQQNETNVHTHTYLSVCVFQN